MCEYCWREETLLNEGNYGYTTLYLNADEKEIYAIGDDIACIKIKYCPMCGRKL